jgi:protein-S-isoprenylcysteine O-methyltransferase Ste14
VYGISRNPVYLAMMLLIMGIALSANSWLMVVATLPAGSVLCLAVIKPEEHFLEQRFGSTYGAYRTTVRRWL